MLTLEGTLGDLVDRQRGGSGGGGSALTATGTAMLDQFEALEATRTGPWIGARTTLDGRVLSRDDDMVAVETAAGRVRARLIEREVASGTERVTVSVPASAAFIEAPAIPPSAGPPGLDRLCGRIDAIDRSNGLARVGARIAGDGRAVAIEPLDRLAKLSVGSGSTVTIAFNPAAARARHRL
ncbi:MAG: hypothetical protein ACOCYZ_01035 [Halococcoides sp.]